MHNSHRNRKFTHTPELNAGDKAKTRCPSALNTAVKKALLKEISIFNAADAKRQAEESSKGGPSSEAYSTWLDQNGGHEPNEANPDVLSENDGLIYLPSKEDRHTAYLLEEVRQLFSPRELQVWNIVMKHNISYQDAADLLSISKATLQGYVRTAKAKFNKFIEEKRDEHED